MHLYLKSRQKTTLANKINQIATQTEKNFFNFQFKFVSVIYKLAKN